MYLHLGNDIVIKTSEIIGIFDLEKSSVAKNTKNFLSDAKNHYKVITVSYEMPKSFIVTDEKDGKKVYISQISSKTLNKRMKLN